MIRKSTVFGVIGIDSAGELTYLGHEVSERDALEQGEQSGAEAFVVLPVYILEEIEEQKKPEAPKSFLKTPAGKKSKSTKTEE